MNIVRWHPEVCLDLLESLQFYKAREPDLGERFMAHVNAAIARAAAIIGFLLCFFQGQARADITAGLRALWRTPGRVSHQSGST